MSSALENYEAAEAAYLATRSEYTQLHTRNAEHLAKRPSLDAKLAAATTSLSLLTVDGADEKTIKAARAKREAAAADVEDHKLATQVFADRVGAANQKLMAANGARDEALKALASAALAPASSAARTAWQDFCEAQRQYLRVRQILGWPADTNDTAARNRELIMHGVSKTPTGDVPTLEALAHAADVDLATLGFAHGARARATVDELRALVSNTCE